MWRRLANSPVSNFCQAEEVSSALLLEQAALADLRLPHPATRKFALHSVMAAHRYQACGQKHLSLRCYDQALALYRGKSWVLVEDHIEHELGRQAYNDGDSEQAVSHLVTLLRPELSHATEHASYLEEFVTAFKFIDKDPEQIVSQRQLALPTPLFDVQQTAIRVTHERNASGAGIGTEDDEGWASLEQRFLASGFGGQNNEEAPEGQTSRKRKRPASLARSSEENVAATGGESSVVRASWVEVLLFEYSPIYFHRRRHILCRSHGMQPYQYNTYNIRRSACGGAGRHC